MCGIKLKQARIIRYITWRHFVLNNASGESRRLSFSMVGISTWSYRPLHVIRMQGILSSIYWTVRSWLWNYPITQDFGLWNEGNPNDVEAWMRNRKRILYTWRFLRPFFASHGYSLYVHSDPTAFCSSLIPCTKRTTAEAIFPFAQYCCHNDDQLEFDFVVSAIYFSQDTQCPITNSVALCVACAQ